jgi:pimeloyl-ACP methyl ester carboxylesterase
VIAATSFGGVFLPLLAEHADALLYIAAAVPEPGRSVRDQFADDPSMFAPGWVEVGRRWFDESQREVLAREFLFHDCDEARAAWALPTVETFHTQHLVTEPNPMTAWPSIPAVSIVCMHDRTITPGWQERTSERLGMKTVILDAGHCPHVSQPEAVASIASAIIRRVS